MSPAAKESGAGQTTALAARAIRESARAAREPPVRTPLQQQLHHPRQRRVGVHHVVARVQLLQLLETLLAQGDGVGLVQRQRRDVLPHLQLVQLAVRGQDDAAPLRRFQPRRLDLDAVGEEGAGKRRERVQAGGRLVEEAAQAAGQPVERLIGLQLVLEGVLS